jgi:hypothetical protein
MADVARASTTAVVVPMGSAENEVAGAVVDPVATNTLDLDHSVITDEEVITGEAVEVEADTMVALLLPSALDQASRTSTSCATLPLSSGSS